jgi:hypothetical protein
MSFWRLERAAEAPLRIFPESGNSQQSNGNFQLLSGKGTDAGQGSKSGTTTSVLISLFVHFKNNALSSGETLGIIQLA